MTSRASVADDTATTSAERDRPVKGVGLPFRLVVEEGKIHEFAEATRSGTPEHHRIHNPVSPVTFLTSAALWMQPENSAWHGIQRNFANILHGEQEFVFHRPAPRAGAELTGQQRLGRTYSKQGRRGGRMNFTEVVTTFWQESADRPWVVATAVSIETEPAQPEPTQPESDQPESGRPARESPAVAPRPLAAYSDLPLTVTDFVKYQGASGDFNPIHHDTEFARASGFPGPFAVGMLPAGIAANRLTERYGAQAVRRLRVRWQNQAWPGDALAYQIFLLPDGDDHDIRLDVTRPDGSPHLQAWATIDPAALAAAGD